MYSPAAVLWQKCIIPAYALQLHAYIITMKYEWDLVSIFHPTLLVHPHFAYSIFGGKKA